MKGDTLVAYTTINRLAELEEEWPEDMCLWDKETAETNADDCGGRLVVKVTLQVMKVDVEKDR